MKIYPTSLETDPVQSILHSAMRVYVHYSNLQYITLHF